MTLRHSGTIYRYSDPFPKLSQAEWRKRMLESKRPLWEKQEAPPAENARRVTHYEDGSFRIEGPQPTLAEFIAHAERFGPAMVLETAESILPISELAQLSVAIQKIREPGKKFSTAKPVKLSKEKQLRLIAFLDKEGLPNSRIAAQLGTSERTVQRLRRELPTAPLNSHQSVSTAHRGDKKAEEDIPTV